MTFRLHQALALVTCMLALSGCGRSIPTARPSAAAPKAVAAADLNVIQQVMGDCVINFPDPERVKAAAKVLAWKRVTDPNQLKALAPSDLNSKWVAWAFKAGGQQFLLSTGTGRIDGQQMAFCVIISQPTQIDATKAEIVRLLKAQPADRFQENGQAFEIYQFPHDGKPVILTFIDAQQMGLKTLNVGVMTDWHAPPTGARP